LELHNKRINFLQNISSHGYFHSCIPEEESFQDNQQDSCLRMDNFHHGTIRPNMRPFLVTSGHLQGRAQSQQCLSLDNLQGEQAQFLATQVIGLILLYT
jgi:hypothetical protein